MVGDVVQAPKAENLAEGKGAAGDGFTGESQAALGDGVSGLRQRSGWFWPPRSDGHTRRASPTWRASYRGFRTTASMQFVCRRLMCGSSVARILKTRKGHYVRLVRWQKKMAYYTIPCMTAQLLSNSSCSTEWVCLPSSSFVYNIEKVEDERGLKQISHKRTN